jgi:hypothetical protein
MSASSLLLLASHCPSIVIYSLEGGEEVAAEKENCELEFSSLHIPSSSSRFSSTLSYFLLIPHTPQSGRALPQCSRAADCPYALRPQGPACSHSDSSDDRPRFLAHVRGGEGRGNGGIGRGRGGKDIAPLMPFIHLSPHESFPSLFRLSSFSLSFDEIKMDWMEQGEEALGFFAY